MIDYSDAANAAGFVDVSTPTALSLAPSSITLAVPAGAVAGVYSATLYIQLGTCRGSAAFTVTVNDVPALRDDLQSNPAGETVCKDSSGVTYSIAAVAGATGYTWTVPAAGCHHEWAGNRANSCGLECGGRWQYGVEGQGEQRVWRRTGTLHHLHPDQRGARYTDCAERG